MTTFESNPVKQRLLAILSYDWRRLPYRVASSFEHDMARICWTDSKNLYYGTGNPDAPIATEPLDCLQGLMTKMPRAIYRGDLTFYPIKKKTEHGAVKLQPQLLDNAYLEFFYDILAGTLGVYAGMRKPELWRRIGRLTGRIESIEDFYGVSGGKQLAGIYQIFMDMLTLSPELAPMEVCSAVAIGNTLYGGLLREELTDKMIPKHIIPSTTFNLKKAEAFFDLVCPDEDSRHNLILATVYPYYKRGNEKFFVLKGAGGSGKSSYIEHFECLLGDKYSVTDFSGLSSQGHERYQANARLQNKLVLHAPESKMSGADKFMSELKKLATGDKFIGRTIGVNAHDFIPDGVLYVDTNEKVALDNSDAILRRKVGITFSERGFAKFEFAPYYKWLRSVTGAASLFLYAYNYYLEDCGGIFEFNQIDLNDKEDFPPVLEDATYRLMAKYDLRHGAYIHGTEVREVARFEKTRWFNYYGLSSKPMRFEGGISRVIAVTDHDVFRTRMKEEGL
ncbi:MAG: hypothetical protein FWD27_00600 [Coriobacteriia bacterium]|nr:hypothetical protein [Coriobacteriia bacterium]